MATNDSLQQSMNNAVKRYSSLFRLPSIQVAISLLAVSCIVVGLLSSLVAWQSPNGMALGLGLATATLLTVILTDYATNVALFRRKTIFNLRRALVLSLFSWGIWLLFILIGSFLSFALNSQGWWIRFFLLGYSVAAISRMVVLSSTVPLRYAKIVMAAFLQPLAILAVFLGFWFQTGGTITSRIVVFVFFAVAIAMLSSYFFLHLLDRLGRKNLGVGSLSLFRAFMLNWVLGLNAPFEQILEKLGEKRDIETYYTEFGSSSARVVMAVPSVHPGPFKNIGSSLLPSLVKAALEKQPNFVACVPHGLMGHEFDLASQEQNQKIIDRLVASVDNAEISEDTASPFVKVTDGLATACGQVFGKSVLVSFTLAPKTIEDLPPELGAFVNEEAQRHGLNVCTAIDAHNSMNGEAEIEKSMDSLKMVASKCLKQVASLQRSPFEVGASTIIPREFRLEDGMGAGGITVVVVKCENQKAAYVVLDGNNMVSGLREEILSSLNSIGIDDGEVFTTDTHAVSALILGKQGYHLIGEVIDRSKLLAYIRNATLSAVSKLQPAKVVSDRVSVKEVTVLGAKPLQALCLLIDDCLKTAKKSVVPVFSMAGILLMMFLLFV